MGKKTPAQRAKTRNPRLKATRHVANRKARKVTIPNENIARVWDTHATLTENYERLGLALDPNKSVVKGHGGAPADPTLLNELEELAAHDAPAERHMSHGEVGFVETLLRKHGDDVEAMARDLKLNPFQQTAGELRRKIALYQSAKAAVEAGAPDA